MPLEWGLALAGGVAVAAACGLRAFFPLLVVGVAGRLGWIGLHDEAQWLARDAALAGLAFATVLEIAADKIPVVDHALDAVGTFVRPVAGALAAYALLPDGSEPWARLAAIALGGGALALHLAKLKFRLGTSVATLGHGNPIVSTVEDVVAALLVIVGIVLPIVALILLVAMIVAFARRRQRAALPETGASLSSPHDRA